MPVLSWGREDLQWLLRVENAMQGIGDAATAHVARQMFHAGIQPDEEDEARLARSRWLDANGAEASFPCGVLPAPEPGPDESRLNVLQITRRSIAAIVAAVLPKDLVFLLEQGSPEVVELGRLPRSAIRETDVIDADGVHLPEPLHDTFETERPAITLLRWANAGADDEEPFAFRSVWLAWQTAHRLRAARTG